VASSGIVKAPMHGNVLKVAVSIGDSVSPGQEVLVMEAMKMEHRLLAEVIGVVSAIHTDTGSQVSAGMVMIEIEADTVG
ncbi:MAG TPA: biotin/lipoyl-containing protein, partial [Kineobactrum sp.]